MYILTIVGMFKVQNNGLQLSKETAPNRTLITFYCKTKCHQSNCNFHTRLDLIDWLFCWLNSTFCIDVGELYGLNSCWGWTIAILK